MSTHNIPFSIIKKKVTVNLQPGAQERVRDSRGKRATSFRATEVLLYFGIFFTTWCA